ncbi:hypothetical protein GN958_ATG23048, partial [Phytophthora infestans]
MQLRYAIAWALVTTQAFSASKTISKSALNGWYPCSEYTFSDEVHPGICETPQGVNSKVDVFVKRLPAANPATAANVWMLQGGPGSSSAGLETDMVTLHAELDGMVNVYTTDHRGTGRSTLLDCVAA